MQFISNRLKYNLIKVHDCDTTEIFESLLDSVDKVESNAEPTSVEDRLAMAVFASKTVSTKHFSQISREDINTTADKLFCLQEYLDEANVDDVSELDHIPLGFSKLLNVAKDVKYVKNIEACKKTERKNAVKRKERMFI